MTSSPWLMSWSSHTLMLHMARIEMYGADWCGYTVRARQLLARKGVDYRFVDVDEEPEAREEMQRRGGGRTIPQIFINDRPVGGSDDVHALDARGELDRLLGR
jgi:glutaredoxin 3